MFFVKTFTSKTQKIGEIGEKLAVMFLMKHGFQVLETNYTKKCGEIDIVAQKGRDLHFIEVKSVSRVLPAQAGTLDDVSSETSGFRPEENMHPKKVERFVRTVDYYLMEKNIPDTIEYQVDLALVYIDPIKRAGKVVLMEQVV
jgi:putative endonuclease